MQRATPIVHRVQIWEAQGAQTDPPSNVISVLIATDTLGNATPITQYWDMRRSISRSWLDEHITSRGRPTTRPMRATRLLGSTLTNQDKKQA